MSPLRSALARGFFESGTLSRTLGPAVVLLVLFLGALPAAGASPATVSVAAPSGITVGGNVAHSHAAPAAGASYSCAALDTCALSAAAPHPAAGAPPPRWTDLQTKVTNQVPAHRYLGSMVYDPLDGYLVLFGGFGNGSGVPYSDTWTYADGHWNSLGVSGPAARYASMMTWDAADGYILLFGGYDSSSGTIYNDTWTFVHGQWNQLSPTTAPPVRWRGAMAFDAADNYTVLFGGTTDTGTIPLRDTWKFSAGSWTDLTSSVTGNPAGHFRQEMAYDAADGYLVMFGGCTSGGCTGTDTLTYSNLTWAPTTGTTKPSARAYEGITYDASQGYVLMYAGDDYSTQIGKSDTWQFLGGNWTDLSSQFTTSPSTRAFEMLAYDAADGYSVLFGGQNPQTMTFFNDTWAFGPSVIAHFVASPATIDLTQSVLLDATPFAYAGYTDFKYSGLPPGCNGGNNSTILCTPTAIGQYAVTVEINDSSGFPTTKVATVTVNPELVVTGVVTDPATVTVGSRFYTNVTAINGTSPFSYAYGGLPPGCSSGNTASLGCTPTGPGTFTITSTVTDATGMSLPGHAGVTVNPKPTLPALAAAPTTIDLGEQITLWANATGGTAPLSYVYTGLPLGCASVDASTLTCTPTATGIGTVHVDVTDAFGWSASGSVPLTVNARPSILQFAVNRASIDIGMTVTFWLNATGGTGAISVLYLGMPSPCNLGRLTTGTCTPTDTGTFTITGSATDVRGITVTRDVVLTVVADPSVDSVIISPTVVDVGQNVTITTVVSGGTAPFLHTYTGLPTASCTNTTSAVVTCRPRTSGVFTIVAQATDTWGMTSQLSASLPVNAAPAISQFAATVSPVTVGSTTLLQVTVTGGSGVYTFAYLRLPAGCTSQNKSTLPCAPSATGTFNVSVTVTDSLGVSASSTVEFAVQPAPAEGGFLGFSGSTGYLVIGAIVVVALIAVAALLMMRRRRPPAPTAEWVEPGPEEGAAP